MNEARKPKKQDKSLRLAEFQDRNPGSQRVNVHELEASPVKDRLELLERALGS
jgi:hypothetical protein